jgi:uncharacterized protein with HEPN domain
VKPGPESNRIHLALGVEHLREAARYSERGRRAFFDERVPDTYRLVESELRKGFESLNRLGSSFWTTNPKIPRGRIGEVRQLLTHDYPEASRTQLWRIVADEIPKLLRQLKAARVPKHDGPPDP